MTNHKIIREEIEALYGLCLECKTRIEDIRRRRANGADLELGEEFELSDDFFSRPLVMIIRKKSSGENTEKKQPKPETSTTTDSPKESFRKAIRTHSARLSTILQHNEWSEMPRFMRDVLKTLWLYLRIISTRSDAIALIAIQELARVSINRLPDHV